MGNFEAQLSGVLGQQGAAESEDAEQLRQAERVAEANGESEEKTMQEVAGTRGGAYDTFLAAGSGLQMHAIDSERLRGAKKRKMGPSTGLSGFPGITGSFPRTHMSSNRKAVT